MVQTIHLAHTPPELPLFVALYRNVENAAFLKGQLLAGNTDFEYAFVNAEMVLSTKHVLAATFRALNDYLNERLKSRNIHSEIVFSFSPNNNIGEAFRRFGVNDDTTNLLVIKVATSPDVTAQSVERHLASAVKGTEVAFDDVHLREVSDASRIKKVYKLGSSNPAPISGKQRTVNGDSTDHDEEAQVQMQVLGIMALRGAT